MRIRQINEKDLCGLLELYTRLHNNSLPEMGKDLQELWSEIVHDKNHHIIVAVDDSKIVSSCVLIIVPNLTHGQKPYALIENVITNELHRGQGLASDCLEYAGQIAKQHGCYKIMLMTGSKKESTLNFYRRAGYNSEDKTAFVQWL
ncbi:GNAT family N-acetyltransferase [Desulfoscipio sp. XC116]|uniref:GNAT family N-acetyltransferase n=1 Tax=Desulfoscipio sp. XC116 TaxID=3144975 RepID=UPI00325AB851